MALQIAIIEQAACSSKDPGGGKRRGAGIGAALNQKGLSVSSNGAYLSFMETQTHWTVLLPVRKGNIWRVQIVWPNGTVHHFGEFTSKEDAADWITAHSRLTMPPEETKGPPLVPSE